MLSSLNISRTNPSAPTLSGCPTLEYRASLFPLTYKLGCFNDVPLNPNCYRMSALTDRLPEQLQPARGLPVGRLLPLLHRLLWPRLLHLHSSAQLTSRCGPSASPISLDRPTLMPPSVPPYLLSTVRWYLSPSPLHSLTLVHLGRPGQPRSAHSTLAGLPLPPGMAAIYCKSAAGCKLRCPSELQRQPPHYQACH